MTDDLDEQMRKHREAYINSVYRDDIHEYADGGVYTADERASLKQDLEEEQ